MAMSRREHLLTILSEECAEVQQIVAKILRFGLDSFHPKDQLMETNKSLLFNEIAHVMAMAKMLEDDGVIDEVTMRCYLDHYVNDKIKNVEKYLKVSEGLGTLEAQWAE